MGNAKKTEQLGMPYGTASGRLLKRLLLRMAQDLHRDMCFRCGKRIETVEEFSIEHKKDWLDVSVDLFWDLDNIAFSHRVCNVAASKRDSQARLDQLDAARIDHVTDAPEGMAWCYGHRRFLERGLFNANKWYPSGVQRYCKECRGKGVGR